MRPRIRRDPESVALRLNAVNKINSILELLDPEDQRVVIRVLATAYMVRVELPRFGTSQRD
jgi:hypothetical protein